MSKSRPNGDKVKSVFKTLFKRGDLILLVVLLVAVALTIFWALKGGSSEVEIYISGQLAYTYDVNVDREVDLNSDGIDMHVVIKDGSVYVKDSDCGGQQCVDTAPISKDGGVIVCLPNKVVIKVSAKEVDATT